MMPLKFPDASAERSYWLEKRARKKAKKNRQRRGRWRRRRRGELYRTQGGRCYWCGMLLAYEDSTIDHVIPKALNGTAHMHNIVISCYPCNQTKADAHPTDKRLKELKRK